MGAHVIKSALAPSNAPTPNQLGLHWLKTTDPVGHWLAIDTTANGWLDLVNLNTGGGGSGESNTLISQGSGTSLVGTKVGTELGILSLLAGDNVTIDIFEGKVRIASTGGSGGGVDVSGADSGAAPILVPDVATLVFDPDEFVLTGDASGLQVNSRPGAFVKQVAEVIVPSTKSLIQTNENGVVTFRRLAAGTNVTLTEDLATGKLTISSTGGTGGTGGGTGIIAYGADAAGNDTPYENCQIISIDGNAFQLVFYDNNEPELTGKEAYFEIRPSWITDVVANKLNVTSLDAASEPASTLLSSAGLKFSNAFTIENDPTDQGVIVKLANQSGGLTEVPHDNAEDSRKFVRGWNAWFTATTWDASLYHVGGSGTHSLVSQDRFEENRLKIKGLKAGHGIQLESTPAGNDITVKFDENLAYNLGYPKDFGTSFKIPCGAIGYVSAALEAIPVFTANAYFAIPFYVHQESGVLDGIAYHLESASKPTSGNIEFSIGKYSRGSDEVNIIYHMSRPYANESGSFTTRPVSPGFVFTEPGLYWLFVRTSVNASTMKMLTLKNDQRWRDSSNVSRVMQAFQFPRYSVAGLNSSSSSLTVGRPDLAFSSWDGSTVCPYVELSITYP